MREITHVTTEEIYSDRCIIIYDCDDDDLPEYALINYNHMLGDLPRFATNWEFISHPLVMITRFKNYLNKFDLKYHIKIRLRNNDLMLGDYSLFLVFDNAKDALEFRLRCL